MKSEATTAILVSTAEKRYIYSDATYQRNRTAANVCEHVCINDRSLAKEVEAVACCCSRGHFAIGNGVEAHKCAVCTARPTALAYSVLAFLLGSAQPRLLESNVA